MRAPVILVCLVLSVACAASAEPVAVAVLNFANQAQGPAGRDWRWLEKGLADAVTSDGRDTAGKTSRRKPLHE